MVSGCSQHCTDGLGPDVTFCLGGHGQRSPSERALLSGWWDYKRGMFFKLLPRNHAVSSNVYHWHLDDLNASIIRNTELLGHEGALFRHNHTRRHPRSITCHMIGTWRAVRPHPPSSPALRLRLPPRPPSELLDGTTFSSDEAADQHLVEVFINKDRSFCDEI